MGLSRKSLYYLLKQDKLNHALNSYKRSYPNNKVREIAYICQVAREVPKKRLERE